MNSPALQNLAFHSAFVIRNSTLPLPSEISASLSLHNLDNPCLIPDTMKKMMLAILLCLSTALMGQSSSAKIASPIQSLEWLVGGVWTTDMSKMGNGMKSIETRYTWSDNGAFLRFNTHFVTDKGTIKRYDGNFYYDSDKKTLAMWYMDSENTIYQGPIKAEGDLTTFDFRGEDFEGKMADLRVVVTRKSNSLYDWALSERDGEKWKPLATLDYSRSQ
jgi:hypothetical protein